MIPITLRLKNFLSYGEDVPTLDFTSFKLACLTGRNGHGKSAILDAMTWAIWGEARKAGYNRRPDADLLRQSAEEMFVEFTFSLNQREYQVYREFHRKRNTGKVEFRVREDRQSHYLVLTANTKRETQNRINQTLGLDYRTFVNSSFLQQGKADEFTRQPPKDRKEILCAILGLDYYARLQEEALKRHRDAQAERKALDQSIQAIQIELEEEPQIIEQEKILNEDLQAKEKRLEALRAETKQINEQINGLIHIRERIERGKEEEIRLKKRIAELSVREEKIQKEKFESQQCLAQEECFQTRIQRYEQIGEQLHKLVAIDEQFQRLESQRLAWEKIIDEQRNQIQIRLASLQSEYQQIQITKQENQPILDARDEIERQYILFQTTQKKQQELDRLKPQFDTLQGMIQEIEKSIERERQTISERIAELRGATQNIPTLKKEIEQALKQLTQKSTLTIRLETLKTEMQTLVERGQENNRLKERATGDLERGQRTLLETREKLDLLTTGQANECPLCTSTLDQSKRASLLERFQEEIASLQASIPIVQKQIEERDKLRADLLNQHQTAEKSRSQLEQDVSRLTLLETDLAHRQAELAEKIRLEQDIQQGVETLEKNHYAQELRTELERLRQDLKQTGYDPEQHAALGKQLNQQRSFEHRWNQLQDILKRQGQWLQRESELNLQISEWRTKLDNEQYALDEKKHLTTIQQEIQPLKKSLETRRDLTQEQQRLKSAPTDWNRLLTAKKRWPELEQDLQQIQQDRGEIHQRIQSLEKERQNDLPALQELDRHLEKHTIKETEIAQREKERSQMQIQLGGIRQKAEHLQKRKEERTTIRAKMMTIEQDERLYKILTTAFSRNGIPAMIVDQVLPELENDANHLLHRLTGGRCSVALESQRETKSGGMSETLDIKISDEMGTRDYEMFSGGEAFRTDLALRIALSQLLCRRAGSKLQLLVIDEGFGTQDDEGLGNIIDAIDEIQDEFEKILMVTHLEELKERFQVRIEINKELGIGSRFEIVHSL